jgi:hypothetical protein
MKSGIKAALRRGVVLASVFAPFLVIMGALLLLPSGAYIVKSTSALDWMWIMLLAAMMLGLYYSTVYYVDDEDVAEAFQKLDRDHDGFITLEDTKTWPDLRIAFAKFDADHDGRLSRLDFDAFEHAVPGR